jgi:small subunit ribosomal protein S9
VSESEALSPQPIPPLGAVSPAEGATPDAPPSAAAPAGLDLGPGAEGPTPTMAPERPPPAPATGGPYLGTGRRKSAVARVRIKPGTGKIVINQRPLDTYFTQMKDRNTVMETLKLIDSVSRWDVLVNVQGGGPTGQSGAIRLGMARALARAEAVHEPALRSAGYMTRDARKVERKKYGHRKARRSFQFSKR